MYSINRYHAAFPTLEIVSVIFFCVELSKGLGAYLFRGVPPHPNMEGTRLQEGRESSVTSREEG